MMRRLLLVLCSILSFPVFSSLHTGAGVSARVMIDSDNLLTGRPADTLNLQGTDNVCIYNSQRYSEGAILKSGTLLLTCVRDKNIIGTAPLVWQPLKTSSSAAAP
ncbi:MULTISPECIES: DUF1496 domain-containing protein [Tatumella]|uniref:DUF1496 domain-containing protein n=1 Tax=Tatumella punctata TaxID=399969 RepID=A0ABW1VK39_9GAMM|nr:MULTISPECIES: DUF1496 domain-containing protein [unclassified Tatumella]MBS0855321.1 DUF1496 domain-containing protein [Tatumella sp. JGM16]MBS0877289.1 DUF1496 domain-containing protein [Tatumella sp. JGM82]MBS0889342.1 DUF1496 domain-containing protein [Tatumella sp. JGM94]MBS0893686.1 DUF1496 domain-containing protein [Tatumella sp. JGM130]MBS0901686.1 DUF1496 domain-containing protein [Tatumella sp. JGM100]